MKNLMASMRLSFASIIFFLLFVFSCISTLTMVTPRDIKTDQEFNAAQFQAMMFSTAIDQWKIIEQNASSFLAVYQKDKKFLKIKVSYLDQSIRLEYLDSRYFRFDGEYISVLYDDLLDELQDHIETSLGDHLQKKKI